MADEIPSPAKNIPRVLMWTVGLGLLTGFPFAIAIWYAVTDVDGLIATFVPPSLQVFYQALRGNTSGALAIESFTGPLQYCGRCWHPYLAIPPRLGLQP